MKIGIKTNLNRDKNASATQIFCKKLQENGLKYLVCDNAREFFEPSETAPMEEIFSWCDIVVSFGGDGTMLDTVRNLADNQPILGINMGKLGFLTEVDESEMDYAIKCLKEKTYTVEKRALLKTRIEDEQFYALNEIIVNREDPCHISTFDIEIDGVKADTVRSDGILVSTPTGSTAYSLSCNGPVLSPTVKALIVNAICPHSLHSCPMVIDDDMKIRILTDSANIKVIVDGVIVAKSEKSIAVSIEKADRYAYFIRFKNDNFYNRLRKKLNYWGD